MAKEPVCAGLYLEYKDGKNFTDNDRALMSAVRAHQSKEFWENYVHSSATYAGLHRYAGYLRREARRRGLL